MSKSTTNVHIKPLKWYNIFGYGCGDAGGCITVGLIWSYMTRYLQVHLAVNPAILATILLIWNVWDAVNDPLMGAIMDIVFARSKHGKDKFRPWILASIPCCSSEPSVSSSFRLTWAAAGQWLSPCSV